MLSVFRAFGFARLLPQIVLEFAFIEIFLHSMGNQVYFTFIQSTLVRISSHTVEIPLSKSRCTMHTKVRKAIANLVIKEQSRRNQRPLARHAPESALQNFKSLPAFLSHFTTCWRVSYSPTACTVQSEDKAKFASEVIARAAGIWL